MDVRVGEDDVSESEPIIPILIGAAVGESSGSEAIAATTSGGGGGVGIGLGAMVGRTGAESLTALVVTLFARTGAGTVAEGAGTSTGPCNAVLSTTSGCGAGFECDGVEEWNKSAASIPAGESGQDSRSP